jgi:hypothetical protein
MKIRICDGLGAYFQSRLCMEVWSDARWTSRAMAASSLLDTTARQLASGLGRNDPGAHRPPEHDLETVTTAC